MPKRTETTRAAAPGIDVAALRKHLSKLLSGGGAHVTFEDGVKDLAPESRGAKPAGAPHSAWELLEHMRIAQWDILEFSRNPKHVSPQWPAGYWPATPAPPDAAAWDRSVAAFDSDLASMRRLVSNPRADLFAPIRHPDAEAHHTLLREAFLVADHNAYHLGELIFLRRLLGSWPS